MHKIKNAAASTIHAVCARGPQSRSSSDIGTVLAPATRHGSHARYLTGAATAPEQRPTGKRSPKQGVDPA